MARKEMALWEPQNHLASVAMQSAPEIVTGEVVDAGFPGTLVPRESPRRQSLTRDLNVIQDAVVRAQRGEPGLNVYVDASGDVIASPGDPGGERRMSSVEGDTFYIDLNRLGSPIRTGDSNAAVSDTRSLVVDRYGRVELPDGTREAEVVGDVFFGLDLNAIQRAVLAAQQNDGRAADKDRVYVDNTGDVMLGDEVNDHSRVAEVVGDTFYARDLAEEALTVRTKMPPSVKQSDGTYEGYSYSVTNRFGDRYDLFIYYDPAFRVYRVALLAPQFAGQFDVHGGHLWPDGTLCLTRRRGSGYPSMEQTYAKSVLWTLGASLYQRGYGFQFNIGQDGDTRA